MHKIKSKIYKKNLKSADLVINPRKDLKGGGIGGRTSKFQNHMILEFQNMNIFIVKQRKMH